MASLSLAQQSADGFAKFVAPLNEAAWEKYSQLLVLAPPQVQVSLNRATSFLDWVVSQQDPRTKDWPLMNPYHTITLVTLYLATIAVLVLFTKQLRNPLPTKYVALFHNLFCTLLSLYMCTEIWYEAIVNRYNVFSQSLDRTPNGMRMAAALWVFYCSKVPEFMDTVLMAVKKNYRQISFLHVYHHSSIFVCWWVILAFAPGGSSYFSAALNSFVHVVMYGYYLWSSVAAKQVPGTRPRWTQPAFYKKFITSFQLIQFCLNFIQANYILFVSPPADFPIFTVWMLFFYMISMLVLFGNFFVQNYGKKRSSKVAAEKTATATKKEL